MTWESYEDEFFVLRDNFEGKFEAQLCIYFLIDINFELVATYHFIFQFF